MTWKEVLLKCPDIQPPVRVDDIVDKFEVSNSHAWNTLELLRRWGYLKYADRARAGRGGYLLTDWGAKMCIKWKGGEEGV